MSIDCRQPRASLRGWTTQAAVTYEMVVDVSKGDCSRPNGSRKLIPARDLNKSTALKQHHPAVL
jgi:hypothetical protein